MKLTLRHFDPSGWGAGVALRPDELFDRAPALMAVVSGPDHRFEAVNQAFRAYMGERQFIGRAFREAAPDLAGQGAVELFEEVYRTGKPYIARDVALLIQRTPGVPPDATRADFVLHPMRDGEGRITGIFLQGLDVTEWRTAEDELRASRKELDAALAETQAIFDYSNDVICAIDGRGVYTKVSRHCEEMWGYCPDEIVGRHFQDFVHPDDLEKSVAEVAQIRAGIPTHSFMNRIIHKDGSVVPVMWSSVWSDAHQLEFAIARDMRDHFRAEEKLREARKMEALGRLTGGIAHDFNNLLTTLIGTAEALNEGLSRQPELSGMAELILETAERGADLVNRLLAFARRQPLTPSAVECGALLNSLACMLRRTLGEDIELVVDVRGEALNCFADTAQLTSAILNLSLNSRYAMPQGGTLTLSVERQTDADGREWVLCTVQDTGAGMPPEVVERALEPFFTTKPPGCGSGLGLSMVHSFVTQSGGRMSIESREGAGTQVRLYLPHTEQAPAVSEPAPTSRCPGAPQLILVVEDDDRIREQIQRQITGLGYAVATSCNGPEALERLSEGLDADLLLTDMVMPGGINGRQLADHARLLKPGIKVLFTSGYTEDEILQRGGAIGAFLPKPYRRAQLAQKLAESLAHR